MNLGLLLVFVATSATVRSQDDVRCLLPAYPANGKYDAPGSIKSRPGDSYDSVIINFSCNSGYRLVGEPTVECTYGEWSSSIPQCERLTSQDRVGLCTLPKYPLHGKYSIKGNARSRPGEKLGRVTVQYECNDGFSLDGDETISCYHGFWFSATPKCIKSNADKCVLPDQPNHGHYTVKGQGSLPAGTVLDIAIFEITCDEGFRINGSNTVSCYQGSWLDVFPTCRENTACILPDFPLFGSYSVPDHPNPKPRSFIDTESLTITFSCTHGYGIEGSSRVTCSKGKWKSGFPKCIHYCQLFRHPSVDYLCFDVRNKTRPCNEFEPPGMSAKAVCKSPDFYHPTELPIMRCHDGMWDQFPVCTSASCKLDQIPGVIYTCAYISADVNGTRRCNEFEPPGAIVRPSCKEPDYYPPTWLQLMHCRDGKWSFVPVCSPECGTVTPRGSELVVGGVSAERGEVPWHAGIYRKYEIDPKYRLNCGGSLVNTKVVISAAHCFWSDVNGKIPAAEYSIAVGKLYRGWNDRRDTDAQKSDVKEIKIPEFFSGSASNFQSDIAIVIVMKSFVYKTYVRPVCLKFERKFDTRQLQVPNVGKVAGWGLISEEGNITGPLQVIDIPYVPIETCRSQSPPDFEEYITNDKFCAGRLNGTALCRGDSGGGLAFEDVEQGRSRYYLRGIVSTAPRNEKQCNTHAITTFTRITEHQYFIEENVQDRLL